MIYTITLNPAVDRELVVDEFRFNIVDRALKYRVDCGGKGFNVARMLKTVNLSSKAMGFAGGKSGEILDQELQSLGIETNFNWIAEETRTNVSIVKSDGSKYIKVNEPGPTISRSDLEALINNIRNCVKPGDWWVLAGSLPPGVPDNIYTILIPIIEEAGGHTILDTSGEALKKGCEARPFLVKPNLEEARQLTTSMCDSSASKEEIAQAILSMGPRNVIISLGKAGALMADGEEIRTVSSPEIAERNPIGAGDAMVAGLVWGLIQNKSLFESLQSGIACGAVAASQQGTYMGSYEMILDAIARVKQLN